MNRPERIFLLSPIFLIGIICLSLLSGCGDSNMFESMADDNTPEAQVSTALEAINTGDYSAAIAILKAQNLSNPNDPEVKKYLASAYMGSTGFDALMLIETMGNDAESDTYSDGGIFTTVNDLLNLDLGTPAENVVTLDANIAAATQALDLLAPEGTVISTLSDEDQFQAGLYGAVNTIYISEKTLDGEEPKNLTPDEITTRVDSNFEASDDDLMRSLDLVVAAQDSLAANLDSDPADSNDVEEGLDEFLIEVGYADGILTSAEFAAYLINQSNQSI